MIPGKQQKLSESFLFYILGEKGVKTFFLILLLLVNKEGGLGQS